MSFRNKITASIVFISLVSLFPSINFMYAETLQSTDDIVQPSIKKHLVLLTSKGGYGHTAACNAMEKTLGTDYNITIVNPFEDILGRLDFVKTMTRGRLDGEKMYNKLLQKNLISFTNFFVRNVNPSIMHRQRRKIEQLMFNYLSELKPDMIISVIPFLNPGASNVAKRLSIPFLLVTTDSDLTNWASGLKKRENNDITATIGFDGPRSRGVLKKHKIGTIHKTGFPIRDDFFEKKDYAKIRKEWNIPAHKFTVMISMGSAGGSSTYNYAKHIARLNKNIHVIACVGRNKKLKRKIERLAHKKTLSSAPVSISTIPFTRRISDLMAVSDLLITKPGPGTINEAMCMKLPMLIDKTSSQLFWERSNITFVKKQGFGDVVTRMSDLKHLLEHSMSNTRYYDSMKQNLLSYEFPHFDQHIKKIVHELCPPR